MSERNRKLLKGWREIAAYFGRDQSTVKRWAAHRGLPVYRAGTTSKRGVPVHAFEAELETWLRAQGLNDDRNAASVQAADVPDGSLALPIGLPDVQTSTGLPMEPPSLPAPHGRSRRQALAIGICVGAAVAGLFGLAASFPDGFGATQTGGDAVTADSLPENVHSLYRHANYLWSRRTREDLLEAERLLKQVTELAPRFADAHADLATVYNLMVEYHTKPADEGYGLSLASAQRAIEIDPRQASALTVLGDLSYFWRKQYDAAFGYFQRAVDADPNNAQARQWYASALMTSGRLNEAAVQIRRARDLNPESRSIIVSQAMIDLALGQVSQARTVLSYLLAKETRFRNPYRFLLFAHVAERDMKAYIRTAQDWFDLIGSATGKIVADAGAAALREGGATAMIQAMAEAARRDDVRGDLERYFRAHVLALAGDWDGALDQLERTPTRQAFYYSIDPAFDEARRNTAFLRKVGELGFPVVPIGTR